MRASRLKILFIGVPAVVLTIGGAWLLFASVQTEPAIKTATTATAATKASDKPSSVAVNQTYIAAKNVQIGMLVALDSKSAQTVVPLPQKDAQRMHGIVIPQTNAAIALTPETSQAQQVLVATSGQHSVLVSTQQGAIKPGDYITVSAISGIGMKASSGDKQVVGRAVSAFAGNADVISKVKVKDNNNKEITVAVGRISVDLNVAGNPLYQESSDTVPRPLAQAANAVAGKPVSAIRIYAALAILAAVTFIVGHMLYSGIQSSMLAVGRNPLSKKSIMRSLMQTVFAALIIFVAGVFAVYLLLKL